MVRNSSRPQEKNDLKIRRILEELKEILSNPLINDTHRVVMLNYGLHYVKLIPFRTFIEMIDSIVDLLISFQLSFKGSVIWKTTNAINEWKYGTYFGISSKHRFLSKPVSILRV